MLKYNTIKNICKQFVIVVVTAMFAACGNSGENQQLLSSKENISDSTQTSHSIRGLADLKGKKVGLVTGSTQDKHVTDNYPEIIPFYSESAPELIPALLSGQISAALLEGNLAQVTVSKTPELAVVGEPEYVEVFGFGFNDIALRDKFNAYLDEKKLSGELASMIQQWKLNYETKSMPRFENNGKNGTIVVWCNPIPPFMFIRNGEFVGLDAELLHGFALYLDVKLDIRAANFSSLIAGAASKKTDMICGGIAQTEERKKQIYFSDPYYQSGSLLVMRKKDVAQQGISGKGTSIRDVFDMKDGKIAVIVGSTQDAYMTSKYPDTKLFYVESAVDIVPPLLTKQVDGALIGEEVAENMVHESPELMVAGNSEFIESLGFGFHDATLRNEFNNYLDELKTSGKLDSIVQKWKNEFETALPPKLLYENSGKNGTLLAWTLLMPPFVSKRGNDFCGIDMELLYGFAAKKGVQIDVQLANFSSIITGLVSKKTDIICCGMTITEERAKQVLFSSPYYVSNTVLVTRKDNVEQKSSITEDEKHKKIGVLLGSAQEIFANQYYPDDEILNYFNSEDLFTALLHNGCDKAFLNSLRANEYRATCPDLVCLQDSIFFEELVFASPKNKKSLTEQLNPFLQELKQSGTLDSIISRWKNNPNATMPEFNNPENNGVWKVAAVSNSAPLTFIKDNNQAGIETEIILRFAAKNGKRVEFSNYFFSGLISALESNKCDFAFCGFMHTSERAKIFSLSEPYCSIPSGLYGIKTQAVAKNTFWSKLKESFYNNIIKEQRYLLIVDGLKTTIIISILSLVLGTILGCFVCFLRMSKRKSISTSASVFIDVIRGIPLVVLLMIMFYVVFASSTLDGIIVASITFAINFAAYVSEMFRTSIESVDKGQTEAGIAMGFTKVQTFVNIILPQALKRVIPVYKGETISLVKMTSIVGYIAVQDLTKAGDIIRSRTFDAFFPLIFIAMLYFILAWLFGLLLTYIEQKVCRKGE